RDVGRVDGWHDGRPVVDDRDRDCDDLRAKSVNRVEQTLGLVAVDDDDRKRLHQAVLPQRVGVERQLPAMSSTSSFCVVAARCRFGAGVVIV
nr:hypothetical protein [Micromonospora sp. DSM 115978]